jgi:hypothetical protein
MGFSRKTTKTKNKARLAYRLGRGVQSQIGTITRQQFSDTTKGVLMIVDDNFVGIVMFALGAVIYLAYKVGEYVGEMKSDK